MLKPFIIIVISVVLVTVLFPTIEHYFHETFMNSQNPYAETNKEFWYTAITKVVLISFCFWLLQKISIKK